MRGYQLTLWRIRKCFGRYSRGIWHLPESQDISCIPGIKVTSFAEDVVRRLKKTRKSACFIVKNVVLWNFPKSVRQIIAVRDGNRLLLSKYAGRTYKKYALLAGYTEIGETIEETVKREVMEEVGLKVKNIQYYKSQPWSFSDTLLMGFYCDLDGEDKITLDQDELALAEWFEREDLPEVTSDESLTNEMIQMFKLGKI